MENKVTERNTKKEILEAYSEVLKQIEENKSKVFDPVQESRQKVESEVVSKINSVEPNKLELILNSIKGEFNNLSEQLAKYNDISTAINIKENELKEMFDIEKSAYTLSALINSNQKIKQQFEEEMKENKEMLNELNIKANQEIKELYDKTREEIANMEKSVHEKNKKEQEEWEYEFGRKKIKDLNSLKDEMKIIEDKINKREENVEQRELFVDSLEKTIEELKNEKDLAVEKAISETTNSIKKSNTYEVNYIKRDFESKLERANDKIESLTDAIENQKTEIKELKEKLDNAYSRVETLASKTVESAGRNPIFQKYDVPTTNNQTK